MPAISNSGQSQKAGKIRKAVGQQLRFIRRNLNHIEQMAKATKLTAKEEKTMTVLRKQYQQQKHMYEHKTTV